MQDHSERYYTTKVSDYISVLTVNVKEYQLPRSPKIDTYHIPANTSYPRFKSGMFRKQCYGVR